MLTKMQNKVLSELHKHIEVNGVAPTVRELCYKLGLKSASTMHTHLRKLERDGYIEKVAKSPRNIKILKLDDSVFEGCDNNIIICSGETVLANGNKTKSDLKYRLYKKDFNIIENEIAADLYKYDYVDIIYNQIRGITVLEFTSSEEYDPKGIILTEWTRCNFFTIIGKIMGELL
ncbi:hypothetical protein [Clostridium gasigenes]|uniref:LexA DNA binding domain-containing protein n=1 Tax=Clostridium gasigenes TaxID=94869 RepID=A0A1H0N7W8_9CLOT|nr:hypothetical protein [Clostridium gasigenes]SDO88804.1 LexA DNA binding domain-containing protein [Clostridium gasigenes]